MKNCDQLIPTRTSLLGRLKNWTDYESWHTFYETYRDFIYHAARKGGLTHTEAEDVVQETVLAIAQAMPNFRYDRHQGSFKTWLLQLVRCRIADELRKRLPAASSASQHNSDPDTASGTTSLEGVADPASLTPEAAWEQDWEMYMISAAIQHVKARVNAKHWQIYDLCFFHQWPPARAARAFEVSRAQVYLIKYRINKRIEKQIRHLRSRIV